MSGILRWLDDWAEEFCVSVMLVLLVLLLGSAQAAEQVPAEQRGQVEHEAEHRVRRQPDDQADQGHEQEAAEPHTQRLAVEATMGLQVEHAVHVAVVEGPPGDLFADLGLADAGEADHAHQSRRL